MIAFDLHVHTLFSKCGLHTLMEILSQARAIGLRGLAITDHGPALSGRLSSVFFERFRCPFDEIKLYKGIECNVVADDGEIDLPDWALPFIDVVLLGCHPNIAQGLGKEHYTSLLVNAIHKNPTIDVITHPNDTTYPVDYGVLAACARDAGVALELNNSKVLYSRSSDEDVLALLRSCKEQQCSIAVCSDCHCLHELALDDSVVHLLKAAEFPQELIVNRTMESTIDFVERRLERKR